MGSGAVRKGEDVGVCGVRHGGEAGVVSMVKRQVCLGEGLEELLKVMETH